jgi:hypothetical protein
LREEDIVSRPGCSVIAAACLTTSLTAVLSPGIAARQAPQNLNEVPAPQGIQVSREEARDHNLRAYAELLRSDLRTQKIAVITQLMRFTDAEDAAFWPIYRQYELELRELNDEKLQLIETYADKYSELTDAVANDLMTRALDLESRRAGLKQKYYTNLKAALSPMTSARALQVENQIQLLVDLQIAASLPVLR